MENTDLQEETAAHTPKKKRHIGPVLIVIVLILACVGAGVYYYMERQKPKETLEEFLGYVKAMDFDSMENLLQSQDLSALDNADVRNAAYKEFFQNINSKMSYEITRTSFDLQNGTAQITARIRYIDGSDIYKETISEFLRQIVSTAFSGEENAATEEETQALLASILNEKSQTVEDKYSETDIIYPLIKIDDQWKIVALDEETVKIMSANFKSVEDEINQSIQDSADENTVDSIQPASEDQVIDLTTDTFTIRYTQHRVENDFAGNPCLLFYYEYTNNSSSTSSAMVDVNLLAYQNGASLEATIPASNDSAIDHYMSEIQPGETVTVCQVFALTDTSDVTLNASASFSFGSGDTASQVISLQ
jgi:uncharacterized protein YaaR (DUF327 family)